MDIIRIFLADDHKILLDGLTALLSPYPHIEIVGTASNGEEALDKIAKLEVDLVLLDISMPVLDGIETAKRLKEKYPRIKILVLTTNDEGSIIKSIFDTGAEGYMLKNSSNQELLSGIEQAYKGEKVLSNELVKNLISGVQQNKPTKITITVREQEVLELLGDGLTNKKIGQKLFLSPHTVITHRRKLLTKLGANTSIGLIRKAIQLGFLKP